MNKVKEKKKVVTKKNTQPPKNQKKKVVVKDEAKKVPVKTEKVKKEKKKITKTQIKNKFLIAIMAILIFCVSLITLAILYVIIFAPEFNEENLYKSASTVLLDKYGAEYARLGSERRELVTYEDLPEVLIDAIIATEDSRFFQHNGFDAPRFGKATIGQLTGKSGAGGGSTITMQVSKNSFTSNEADGIAGLIRKFTDIYLSMFKIEKNYTKEQILEYYVNGPFLGSNSFGVEQISQTYFGKSIRDVTLVEAAVIAGLFQAPGAYNPYTNPDATNNRKNTVLNLMYKHGYITAEERDIAKSIDVRNLVIEKSGTANKYQAFIDTVIEEVRAREKVDPTGTSMIIYTTMDPKIQDVINGVENGVTMKFVNDVVELGIAVTSVKDGSIVGIGAGRNKNGELTYNYATQIKRHPGSTAKPYMVYGPGFEYNNWSTATTFFDEPWQYSNGQKLKNADGKYNGIMTLRKALTASRNIPAIQGFQQLENKKIVEFATSIGIKLPVGDYGEIFESAAIGGFDGVNPLEQSAAYATFARGGYYIEPYSYTKIEYRDTEKVVNNKYTSVKAMKESTAHMINMVLKAAVEGGLVGSIGVSGTDIAGKTGTSTFDASFRNKVGLPSSAIMDSWVVTYSPDYSIAQWYGYKEMTAEMVQNKQYLVSSAGVTARKAIAKQLSQNIYEKNSRFGSVKGVIRVEIELETIPVQLPSANTPSELRSSEWFVKGTEPTEVSPRFAQLENVTNLSYTINPTSGSINLSWDPANVNQVNTEWLQNYFKNNYASFANKYYQRRLTYNASHLGTVSYRIYLKNSDGSLKSIGTTTNRNYMYTSLYPNGLTFVVKTEYSIFKSNASSGASVTINTETAPESTVEVKLRGSATITVPKGTGNYTYTDTPVNVVDNGVNVTDKAVVTESYTKEGSPVNSIDLSIVGNYKILYKIVYNNITYNLTRDVIVSD